MSCTDIGSPRWPATHQCFGHGVCAAAAPANLTGGLDPPSAALMCVCDAGWSSSGDFIYSPLAQCHIRQDTLLALWSLSVLVVLLAAIMYARVLRAYSRQLPLRRRYEPVQLLSQVSSMKTTTTIKLRPAVCGLGERVYRRVCWVLRSPTRCCLLGVFMLLLCSSALSVLKVVMLSTHLHASSTEPEGSLIGRNWTPTVLYVVSALAFLATGHCSTMLWCASARAFDPRPIEGAALRASTQRELWFASAVHCACYSLVFFATGLAHRHDWWQERETYELLVSLHFQIKAVIPLVCWITDRRITSKLLDAMLVHGSPPAIVDVASKQVIPSKINHSGGGSGGGGGGGGGLASGLGGGGGGTAGGVSVLAVAGSAGIVSRKPSPLALASEVDPASSMKKLSWDKGVDAGIEAKLSKSKSGGGAAGAAGGAGAAGVQMATLAVDSPSNRADRRNSQQLLHAGRNRRPSLDIGPVRLTPYEPRTSLSQHSPRSPRTMLSSNGRRARRSSDRLHFNFSPRQQSVPALPLSPPHLAMGPAAEGVDTVHNYSPSSTSRSRVGGGGGGVGGNGAAGNPHFQLLAPEMDASSSHHPPSSTVLMQPSPRHPAGSTLSVQGSHSKAALSADLTVNFASSFAMHSRNVSSSMQLQQMPASQLMMHQAETAEAAEVLLPGQLQGLDSVEYLPRCIDDAASPTVQTRTLGFIDSPFSVSNRTVEQAPPLPAGEQTLSLLRGYRIPRPVAVHTAPGGGAGSTVQAAADAVGTPGVVAASASDHSDSDDEADAETAAYCIRISGVERVNTVKKLREHLYSQQQQQQQQQQRAEHQSGASAVAAAILNSSNAAAAATAAVTGNTPSPASSPPAAAASTTAAHHHHHAKPVRTISFATSEAEDAANGSINGSSGGGGEGHGGIIKLSPALERIIAAAESRRGTSSSKAVVSSKAPAVVTTGRQHKLPSGLSRSRSHGVLSSFGVAAGVAPLRSQTKLLTLQRARLIEFASRLAVHNRSTAAISLVWLVVCSCFAWIPFLRALVSYVLPLQAVATLLAVRTFLHTHSPLARRANGGSGGGLSHKTRPFVGSQQSRPPTGLVLGDQRLGTRLEGDASAMPTHTHAGGGGGGIGIAGGAGGAVSGLNGPLHTQKGVTMLVRGGHAPHQFQERSNLHTNSRFHPRFASSGKHDEIVSQARAPSPSLITSNKA